MYEVDWDKVADAYDRSSRSGDLGNSFLIRGRGLWGGCLDVQSKLSEYGVCRFVRWDPAPPDWCFLFDTHLTKQQVLAVLGAARQRWQVNIE